MPIGTLRSSKEEWGVGAISKFHPTPYGFRFLATDLSEKLQPAVTKFSVCSKGLREKVPCTDIKAKQKVRKVQRFCLYHPVPCVFCVAT